MTNVGSDMKIDHFTVVFSVPLPLNRSRLAVTLFCYKPSCFSYVNDHVHRRVSMSIPRFAHEKQEGL